MRFVYVYKWYLKLVDVRQTCTGMGQDRAAGQLFSQQQHLSLLGGI